MAKEEMVASHGAVLFNFGDHLPWSTNDKSLQSIAGEAAVSGLEYWFRVASRRVHIRSNVDVPTDWKLIDGPSIFLQRFPIKSDSLLTQTRPQPRGNEPPVCDTSRAPDRSISIGTNPHREWMLDRLGI